jgi:hypothetical protein
MCMYAVHVHPMKEETIVDVHVIFPESAQNASFDLLDALFHHHEAQKYIKNTSESVMLIRGFQFLPIIVTTDGAMGPAARQLIE